MPDKTELEKFQDSAELMTADELDAGITAHAGEMNAYSNAAEDARKKWLLLRDEQKRRMRL